MTEARREKITIGAKKKTAFVCSGGGTKAGAFHLGVALALQEQGFRFLGGTINSAQAKASPGPMDISVYVGSSAGSIITSFLAAGYSLDNIFNSFLSRAPSDPKDAIPRVLSSITYPKMFKIRPELAKEQLSQLLFLRHLLSDLLRGNWGALLRLNWIKISGIFSVEGIEQYLSKEVLPSNRFEDYLADLFIVATQLNHSRKVVFGKYRYQPPPHDLFCQYDNGVTVSEACAASIALPFVFAPYSIKNEKSNKIYYIDGEIRDTLSTHVAVDAGADLIISSYTHQPYHFQKAIGSLTEMGLPSILVQSIYLVIEQKINNHIHNKKIHKNAIDAVYHYCKQAKVSDHHVQRICEILETELHHKQNIDVIYIHPQPDDTQMFFGEHFSLSPKKLSEVVKSGFRAAIDVLKKYDFEDRKEHDLPPIVSKIA
ncbi:MAG: patatin-like phospholipase family protein [Deltaproteobacteria bacterium]|nr:patatin-like phospholipase family protein [Deltaproteobacteria bacterium]